MADPRVDPTAPPRDAARLALFAIGVALAAVAGLGGIFAAIAGWLAQPAFALAVRVGPRRDRNWKTDLPGLALLWGVALLIAAALIAWPLSALQQGNTLGHAVVFSAAIGIALVALWGLWPLWHAVECEGGVIGQHWRTLRTRWPLPASIFSS